MSTDLGAATAEHLFLLQTTPLYALGNQTKTRRNRTSAPQTAHFEQEQLNTRCLPRSAEVSLITRFWFLHSVGKSAEFRL